MRTFPHIKSSVECQQGGKITAVHVVAGGGTGSIAAACPEDSQDTPVPFILSSPCLNIPICSLKSISLGKVAQDLLLMAQNLLILSATHPYPIPTSKGKGDKEGTGEEKNFESFGE